MKAGTLIAILVEKSGSLWRSLSLQQLLPHSFSSLGSERLSGGTRTLEGRHLASKGTKVLGMTRSLACLQAVHAAGARQSGAHVVGNALPQSGTRSVCHHRRRGLGKVCLCVCAQPVARTLLMMHPVKHYVVLDAACGASLRCSLWRIPADAALELWMQPVAHPYRYSLGTMDTARGASIQMLR